VFAFQVATVVVAEEESNNQGRRTGFRGSILGHNIVNCNRKEGELRLYNDYFAENPKFTETQFRRRFRMSRRLFLRSQMQWKLIIHISNKEQMLLVFLVYLAFKR
jgi:hypothetical protein